MCGLIQSTFVNVPVIVNCLVMSKTAEGEWWARARPAAKSRMIAIKVAESLCLKEDLPLTLWAEYNTRASQEGYLDAGFGCDGVSPPFLRFANDGKTAGGKPAQQNHGAISSRRRSLVSTMQVAANAPTMLIAANIKKTEWMPFASTINPTSAGPTAEAILSQEVARPVPIARMRVG